MHLLLTTRDRAYRGLGARLLEEAKKEARNRGIALLRLSCYAGADGGLVRVYEKMGFSRIHVRSLSCRIGTVAGRGRRL